MLINIIFSGCHTLRVLIWGQTYCVPFGDLFVTFICFRIPDRI